MDYHSLDIGYCFIVEAGRLAFPTLPDNHLRALALQLLADLGMLVLVYALFAPWDAALGALAALLYAGNKVFCWLVCFAFYYYWEVPFTFEYSASCSCVIGVHPGRPSIWGSPVSSWASRSGSAPPGGPSRSSSWAWPS